VADLDEISCLLGEIRSDVKHAVKWFDEHEARDQERFEAITARLDAADLTRSIVRLELVESEIRSAMPVIEGVKKARWVLAGFVAALGLVGGAIGGVATNAMKWFV
jgi:hypothetical protein